MATEYYKAKFSFLATDCMMGKEMGILLSIHSRQWQGCRIDYIIREKFGIGIPCLILS